MAEERRARRGWSRSIRRLLEGALFLTLGCSAAGPPPSRVEGVRPSDERLDGAVWLEGVARRAQAAGAGALQVLRVGAGTPGDHHSALVNVPAGRCALFLARGSDTVEDLDLFVYGDDGALLGADEAHDEHPGLLVCPEFGRRLYVSARVSAGHGLVALGAQEVAPGVAREVARAAQVRGADGAETTEAWPGLSEAVALQRRRLGGAWEDRRRVPVPVDARMPTHVSASLEGNTCLDALVLTTEEIVQLELEVLDASGRIFGRAAGGLPRSLLVCSRESAQVTFRLRPHQGQGTALLILSATRPGTEGDLDPEIPRATLLADAAPTNPGGSGDGERRALRGAVRAGSRSGVRVPWAGGCGRLDVQSDGELLGLEIYLWSSAGELLASGAGLTGATLFPCSPADELRLDLEATRRGGSFSILPRLAPAPVAPAPAAPASERSPSARASSGSSSSPGSSGWAQPLLAHPLAASRLLERLHRGGHLETPSAAGEVRSVSLSTTQLERVPLTVPAARCLDVFLGVGPGVQGAELRLLEEASGREIELIRVVAGGSARACGDGTTSPSVVAELRATAGQGTGLVATRLLGGTPRPTLSPLAPLHR